MALPSGISFSSTHAVQLPPRFNVAVPFIDRHLTEGRGEKAAILTREETVTYAELAARVNRAGNALLALGLEPGDRLLMAAFGAGFTAGAAVVEWTAEIGRAHV